MIAIGFADTMRTSPEYASALTLGYVNKEACQRQYA